MSVDDVLGALRSLAKPRLSPFFAQRSTASITQTERKPVPIVLKIYWLLVIFAAAPLVGTWVGVGAIALAGSAFAFPDAARTLAGYLIGPDPRSTTSPRS